MNVMVVNKDVVIWICIIRILHIKQHPTCFAVEDMQTFKCLYIFHNIYNYETFQRDSPKFLYNKITKLDYLQM
jgi:hypothetical protein